MRRLFAASLVTTIFLSPAPADAKCAMDHQQPVVLTASVAVPTDGGGIVVGTASISYELPDMGEALQKSWGFLTGRDLMQPVITVLAPGLVVYGVQPNLRTTGELTDGTKVIAKLTVTKDKVAKLAAPKIAALTHASARAGSTGRSVTITAKLAGAGPADAVALIVFDRSRTPRSWGRVTAGATELAVFHHGRCEVLPDGTIESQIGDKVSVAWVDRYGRLSAPSKILTIKKVK